jgi:hypothetical protein
VNAFSQKQRPKELFKKFVDDRSIELSTQGASPMTDTAVVQAESTQPTWRVSAPHVRQALKFIKRRGSVTADELVEWDRTHGQRLFDWNDPHAAEEWRKQQARCFLNSFRKVFDGMRVRAIIHIREDETEGIERSAYFGVEAIAQHPGMRAQIISDITARMQSLASELQMWQLTKSEQEELFRRLADAMAGKPTSRRPAA